MYVPGVHKAARLKLLSIRSGGQVDNRRLSCYNIEHSKHWRQSMKDKERGVRSVFSQYKGLKRENYILFFGRIVTNLGSMVWPMLTLILTSKLNYSAEDASLLMIVAGFILLPFNLLGGTLADRMNKKYIIVICDLISVALYVTCAFIPLTIHSLVLIVIAAAAQNLEHPAYNGIIADITPTMDRERAFSLQYLGMNLGFMAAPTIAGLLFKDFLWLSFLISGISIFCSTVLIFFLVRDITPVEESIPEAVYQKKESRGIMRLLFSSGALMLYMVVITLYHVSYQQFSYLMPIDLTARHGDAGSVIYGTINSVNCIVCVVFTPLITRAFKRWSTVGKIMAGILLTVAAFGLFMLPFNFIPLYYVGMVLFTLGEVFTALSTGPHLNNRISAAHRGRINAVNGVLQSLVAGICMYVTGVLYDASETSLWAWLFVTGIAVTSILLGLFLFKADKKKYPALYTPEGLAAD